MDLNSKLNYPSLIRLLENTDKLIIPYFSKELNSHKISFVSVLQG